MSNSTYNDKYIANNGIDVISKPVKMHIQVYITNKMSQQKN